MIKKEGNLFYVFNKEGTEKLSKGYETEEEANKRLQEIEFFKHKKDSAKLSNLQYELNQDTIVLYNVPIIAEMVQQYDDGTAFKPFDVIKNVEVDQVPLTILENIPDHPDRHLTEMATSQKAGTVVGFMTEPSRPRINQDQKHKRYADFVIYRTPKTKALEDSIINGETIDTSIGFTFEPLNIKGTFENKNYDYIQSDIHLDHNAILIDAHGNKGIGRMPSPIGGIGADAQSRTIQTLLSENEQIDKLKQDSQKREVNTNMEDKTKQELDSINLKNKELIGQMQEKDTALRSALDKVKDFEVSDANLKKQIDTLKRELDVFKAERKAKVDAIKDKLSVKNPSLKTVIDSATDEVLLKMDNDIHTNDSNREHISARMNGNDKNNKKINDKAIENYFKQNPLIELNKNRIR